MLGPVTTAILPPEAAEFLAKEPAEIAIVGDEGFAPPAQGRFDDGMAAAADLEIQALIDLGPNPVQSTPISASAASDVDRRQRLGRGLDFRGMALRLRRKSVEDPTSRSRAPHRPRWRCVLPVPPSSLVEKRMAPAIVWRWMKVALNGGRKNFSP